MDQEIDISKMELHDAEHLLADDSELTFIQKEVEALYDIYEEFAHLIGFQGDKLDIAKCRTDTTKENVGEGLNQIREAEYMAKISPIIPAIGAGVGALLGPIGFFYGGLTMGSIAIGAAGSGLGGLLGYGWEKKKINKRYGISK